MIKLVFFSLWCVFSCVSFAGQQLNAVNDNVLRANISANDLTEIRVKGDRISKVRGIKENYELMKDNEQGIIFVKPFKTKTFHLFLSTEKGAQYQLRLTPEQGKEANSLILTSETTENKQNDKGFALLESMVSGSLSSPNEVEKPIQRIQGGVQFLLIAKYHQADREGLVYRLKNQTDHPIELNENDFYQAGVLLLSLSQSHLNGFESSYLYEVKKNGNR